MKSIVKFFVAVCLLANSTTLYAQVVNIPEKSKKHFAEKYSKAKNVDWGNNVTNYSATFNLGSDTYKAHYHMDGVWDYTEKKLDQSKFPAAVKDAYKKSRVANWDYQSAAYIENNKGEKLYRLEVKKGIERKYIFYDKSGKEIRSSSTI